MTAMLLAQPVQWVPYERLHGGVGHMELLAQLPAELVAVAGPSARGAAPLLRPVEPDTESTATPLPFDLYLTLLTTPQPTGQPWPLTGKELPVVPRIAASTAPASAAASGVAPPPFDAALFAHLKLASLQAATSPQPAAAAPALPLPNAAAPASVLPASAALPATSGEAAPPLPFAHDAAIAVPPPAAELVALESAESALPAPPVENTEPASWLERVAAADARASLQGPAAELEITPPMQARSALAPDARLTETVARLREAAPPLEVMKLSQVATSAVLEVTKVGTDWLPAAHGSGTSAAATAAAPAPLPAASVDLRTPNWQETFASRVQWLLGSNAGEARITLNPPELGAVDVKVSLVDDKTYVQLTTATAAARDELSQSLPRLKELFAASGLELGGASVHDGRGDHRAGHGDRAAPPDPRPIGPFVELAPEPTAAVSRRLLGRVDVFA